MSSVNNKVIVGMSGGVDSSVALILLKKQGFEPIGVFLKLATWNGCARENSCCTDKSKEVASKICHDLDVKFKVIDVAKEFKEEVIDYFIKEHERLGIPNPCVICNPKLKFRALSKIANRENADFIATGHYAKIKHNKSGFCDLVRAVDLEKDQTYTLAMLDQKILDKIIFPLGGLIKKEVYQIAKKAGYDFFEKIKESSDFCFVSGKDINKFLAEKIEAKPGDIVDEAGIVIGKHQGLHFYTIGQKKNLNVQKPVPFYVLKKDKNKNQIITTDNLQHSDFHRSEIFLKDFHFINPKKSKNQNILVKIRYGQKAVKANLEIHGEDVILKLKKPVKDVNAGQFGVCYSGKICLGGGRIKL